MQFYTVGRQSATQAAVREKARRLGFSSGRTVRDLRSWDALRNWPARRIRSRTRSVRFRSASELLPLASAKRLAWTISIGPQSSATGSLASPHWYTGSVFVVEDRRLEPLTSCMPCTRSARRFAANTSGFRHLRRLHFTRIAVNYKNCSSSAATFAASRATAQAATGVTGTSATRPVSQFNANTRSNAVATVNGVMSSAAVTSSPASNILTMTSSHTVETVDR